MTNHWEAIWKRRGIPNASGLPIDELIRLNGFDNGAGKISGEDWISYARTVVNHLGIQDNNSVFEVGCGAGAFLAAMRRIKGISIGGIDYSEGLIKNARQALPDGEFFVGSAGSLATLPAYDFLVSNSVFQYFSISDAGRILNLMLSKASRGVAILDVPDHSTQVECELFRRGALQGADYDRKYAGLAHTYFDRRWFASQVNPEIWRCDVNDGFIPNYAQNRFRFAVMYRRNTP